MSRTLIILLVTPVVLLLLAVVLLPMLVDREQLLAAATSAVEEQTGAKLRVDGEAELSVFPTLAVALGQVSLELPGETPQTIEANALEIAVQLMPLISREIVIDGLTVDGLSASVQLPESANDAPSPTTENMSDAELDAFYAQRRQSPAAAPAGAAVIGAPLALNIGRLAITNANIDIKESGDGKSNRIIIDQLTATSVNTDGLPMALSLKLQLPETTEQSALEIQLESELEADMETQRIALTALDLGVSGATPEPVNITASGIIELDGPALDLELRVRTGATEGEGQVRYDHLGSPQIDANLHFNLLNPALLVLAGPEAAAASPPTASTDSDRIPLDLLRSIDTRLELRVDEALVDAYQASDLRLQLRLVDGILDITELAAEAMGGKIDLRARFDGKYNDSTLTTDGTLTAIDIDPLLTLAAIDQDLTGKLTAGWQMTARGSTFSALAASLGGKLKTSLKDGRYQGKPLYVDADGSLDLSQEQADLSLNFGLAEMQGEGQVRYAGTKSPQIDARLHMNLLDPALLLLAGPEAIDDAPQSSSATEDGGDEPLQLEPLRSIDTAADLKIDRAVYENHAIDNLHLQARAVDGIVKINSLTGQLHGGELRLGATLNATEAVTRVSSRGSIKGLEIPELLTSLESEPVMTGTATANWQINSRGTTTNELYANLRGPAKLVSKDAVLKDTGIEKMLCQSVALVNQQKLSGQLATDTVFQDLSMDIQLGGGKARLKPLRADLQGVSLRGQGELNLLTDVFEADFAGKLSSQLAEMDPACAVNERYTAIDWPVSCKGNITGDPADWCGVDSGAIIEELATNEVKRKVQKEAGKLLEGLLKR